MSHAIQFASKYNMGMEFECNRNVTSELHQKLFNEYLDYFDKNLVLNDAPIAYYDDRGTLFDMANSADPVLVGLYNRICRIVADRQKRADQLYNSVMK